MFCFMSVQLNSQWDLGASSATQWKHYKTRIHLRNRKRWRRSVDERGLLNLPVISPALPEREDLFFNSNPRHGIHKTFAPQCQIKALWKKRNILWPFAALRARQTFVTLSSISRIFSHVAVRSVCLMICRSLGLHSEENLTGGTVHESQDGDHTGVTVGLIPRKTVITAVTSDTFMRLRDLA